MKIELHNGDCLEVMKSIPDNSIDLVLTDCPYKIVSGGCTTKNFECKGVLSGKSGNTKNGKLFNCNSITFGEWLPDVFRVLKQETHCYIMINGRNLAGLQLAAQRAGFKYQNLLVWNKGNKTPNRYYMQQCEFILMLRKGGAKTINNAGTSNLFSIKNKIGKRLHPTEKPLDLIMELVSNSSKPRETALDPFMGSGTTGVACKNLNRSFIGIELDKDYFEVAKKRIDEAERTEN